MRKRNEPGDAARGASSSETGLKPRYADFADRLNRCGDLSPDVPSLGNGRLTFVRDKLATHGVLVSLEAVRRWFSGLAMPRREHAALLAEMLGVETYWLLEGGEENPRDRSNERNASAPGAVNLVAALIQLDGGSVAFPQGLEGHVDMYAIFDGVHHAIRVVVAEEAKDGELYFMVRTSPVPFIHIGVLRKPGMRHQLYFISDAAVDAGQRKGAASKVKLKGNGVRRITSFEKALES